MKKINGILALNVLLEGEVIRNESGCKYKIENDTFTVNGQPTTMILSELLTDDDIWETEFLPVSREDRLSMFPINLHEEFHDDEIDLHYEVVGDYMFFCNGTDVCISFEQLKKLWEKTPTCGRFGKGSVFEDVECMTCDCINKCNSIAREERIKWRRDKSPNDLCQKCDFILQCKRYSIKHTCDHRYIPSSKKLGESICNKCNCYMNCIRNYNTAMEFVCTKDIEINGEYKKYKYTKGEKYNFIIIYYKHKGEDLVALYDDEKLYDFVTNDFTETLVNYFKPSIVAEMELAMEEYNRLHK